MRSIRTIIIGVLLLSLAGCYGLPTKKTIAQSEGSAAHIEPHQNRVTLVIIRPYNYYYFGHPVEVLVNHVSQLSIPNQSYSAVTVAPGEIEVRGQSGLLGPPTQDIKIEGHADEVVYLLWKTIVQSNYTSIVPIVILRWQKITKEEADSYLKDVEYVGVKNVSSN